MEKFANGDTVVFFGDSITANGKLMQYVFHYYMENTDRSVKMYNLGIPGDTAADAVKRMDMIYKLGANRVVIMFGMNDVPRHLYRAAMNEKIDENVIQTRRNAIDRCVESQTQMMKELSERDISVTVCRPTLYDEVSFAQEDTAIGIAAALYEIGARLETNAKKYASEVLNFSDIFYSAQRKALKCGYSLINPDRVHPTDAGQIFLALVFLKAQGFDVDPDGLSEKGLAALSVKDYGKDENRRFEIEHILGNMGLIDFCVRCNTIREGSDFEQTVDKFIEQPETTIPYISDCCKIYKKERDNKQNYIKELVGITEQLVNNRKF